MTKTTEKDAKMWIDKLKKQGIKEFEYRHLPTELKERRMIRKSSFLGLIIKKTKTDDYRNIWIVA